MKSRWLAIGVVAMLLGAPRVGGQEGEAPPARRARPARPTASTQAAEERAFLNQLADSQRGLGEQLQQLRERVDAVHRELATGDDTQTALRDEVKALREEVKGLYVESSTVKQQIDDLKQDVAAVDSHLAAFRTASGIFAAIMTMLLVVVLVLTIRR